MGHTIPTHRVPTPCPESSVPFRKVVRAVLAGVFASCVTACAWAQWTTIRPMSVPRQETGAAIIGDVVYVCGGLIGGPPFVNTATVETYHMSLGIWSSVAPMPLALDHAGTASLDGKLYVMGGVTRIAGVVTSRDDVHVYDPATNTWSVAASLPLPRVAPWAVALNARIYLVGGLGPPGGARGELYEFDPVTNVWTERAPMPTPREHLTAATDGTFLYVTGGRVGGTPSAAHERYDPSTNLWTTLAPMPTARAGISSAFTGSELHYIGGETPMLFDVHEVYDIATNAWTTLSPMPFPRHGAAAVTLPGGGILIPGGGEVQGLGPVAHTDVFGPVPPTVPVASPTAAIATSLFILVLGLRAVRRHTYRNPAADGRVMPRS